MKKIFLLIILSIVPAILNSMNLEHDEKSLISFVPEREEVFNAIRMARLKGIERLNCCQGFNPNLRNDNGYTPLAYICDFTKEDPWNIKILLKLLENRNIDINGLCHNRWPCDIDIKRTPLRRALGRGKLSFAEVLLKSGKDIDIDRSYPEMKPLEIEESCLSNACFHGFHLVVWLLLSYGAKIDDKVELSIKKLSDLVSSHQKPIRETQDEKHLLLIRALVDTAKRYDELKNSGVNQKAMEESLLKFVESKFDRSILGWPINEFKLNGGENAKNIVRKLMVNRRVKASGRHFFDQLNKHVFGAENYEKYRDCDIYLS